jgi:propionyl-CoA carboxylase alpha chain
LRTTQASERTTVFEKLLIANRGEIACRIARTARRMGIATVAVYSDADRRALHVTMADEAVRLGPAQPAESYLAIEKIVAACKATGAAAVHPGYGFLSERAAFAEALSAAGVAFIGPDPAAIEAMGDKIASKKFADAANVATVPGHLEVVRDAAHAVRVADAIGYPVMIKASAGGGGKGMRIAHSPADVAEGFERAMSEARSSFGDDRLLIEKYIVDARHVEMQILGDRHGNVIHLGERECSIQRRNQKVVEEAPSPLLDAATRRAMGHCAIALARAVGYDSAGTVEFVVAQDRTFYFLEMNTRLQVEHPVTELVTGIDIVEEMIRIAAGEPLRITQADVKLQGWAIESRVYAEDPSRDFLPSIGRLVTYRPPEEGTHAGITVRNDTGVVEGDTISIFYDPLIAKLVTHARTREDAIDAQAGALDAFAIEGIRHNVPFLSALMRHPRWRSGHLATTFIADEFPRGFTPPEPTGEIARKLAAVAAAIFDIHSARERQVSDRAHATRRAPLADERVVLLGSLRFDIVIEHAGKGLDVRFTDEGKPQGDAIAIVSHWRPGEPVWHGACDGAPLAVHVRTTQNGVTLEHAGTAAEARVYSRREARAAALMHAKRPVDAGTQLRSPMPGVIVSIAVTPGQPVKTGDVLCVVEAMKMENVLRAERDGVVTNVHARAGDVVAVDAPIMEFAFDQGVSEVRPRRSASEAPHAPR